MLIDMCGQTFDQLHVVCISDKVSNGGERLWVCECSCGNIIHVRGYELRSGARKCCPRCVSDRTSALASERAAEKAKLKEAERAEKRRLKEEEKARRALEKETEAAAKKPVKVSYEPKTDCRAYMGDRCAGLKEMLCRTKGKCNFYKPKENDE